MIKEGFRNAAIADLDAFEAANPGIKGAEAHARSIAYDDKTGIKYLVTGDKKFRQEVRSPLAAIAVVRAVANAHRIWAVFPDGTRILQAAY